MDLYLAYLKLITKRFRKDYLFIIISIITIYSALAIITIYIDNIFMLSRSIAAYNFNYMYGSIRAVLLMAGISYIINQYYNVMKSTMKDYCILKALGATKHNIRILMAVQVFSLILITVPFGLFMGYSITKMIISMLVGVRIRASVLQAVASANTVISVSAAFCLVIIAIGIYLERGIKKIPAADILLDYPTYKKEV